MAEYLHLYTEDDEVMYDLDLRGSTYHVTANGWTPATMTDNADLVSGTVTESIELWLTAASVVAVEDAIGVLRRVLTEAGRRAALGRVPTTRTYLRRLPDGGEAHDYRTAEVVGGTVQRQAILGRRDAQASSSEFHALVMMQVAHKWPLGPQERLSNLVINPSFEVDSNADGLANDWSETGDAAAQTCSIVAVDTRYGRYGQRLQYAGATAATGVKTGNIGVTAGNSYLLQAWADNNSTAESVLVYAYDVTNSAVIAASTLTWTHGEAPSLKQATFAAPGGCANVQVRAVCATAAGSVDWIVDGVYLGDVTSLTTQAWSSYCGLVNHDDGLARSVDHNWLLVANVPGDAPAMVEMAAMEVTLASGNANRVWGGRRAHDHVYAPVLWFQAEDGDLAVGYSLDTDAGASGPAGNNCIDYTLTLSCPNSGCIWNFADSLAEIHAWGTYRSFLLVKRLANQVTLYAKMSVGEILAETETASLLLNTADWRVMPGPVIRFPPGKGPASLAAGGGFMLHLWGDDTEEIRLDAIALVPVDEEALVLTSTGLGSGDTLYLSGLAGVALRYDLADSLYYVPLVDEGLILSLTPQMPQLLSFLMEDSTGVWRKADSMEVTLDYYPRYHSL